MLRSIYHLKNGAIRKTPPKSKATKHYDWEHKFVANGVRRAKNWHVVPCFYKWQVDAIIEQSTVELEWERCGDDYKIWRKRK